MELTLLPYCVSFICLSVWMDDLLCLAAVLFDMSLADISYFAICYVPIMRSQIAANSALEVFVLSFLREHESRIKS